MSERTESNGGEIEPSFTEEDLRRECYPNKCAVWCVTILYGLTRQNYDSILTEAERIKEDGVGLNIAETCQLGRAFSLFDGYTSYKYILNNDTIEDVSQVISKIRELNNNGKLNKSIICVDDHCAIGKSLDGKYVYVNNVNPTETRYDTINVRGVIY